MKAEEVKRAANGRWPNILPAIGVGVEFLKNRGGPCPICKGGRDRFRFDDQDGDGTWFCSHCVPSAGDGISLAQKVNGWSFQETLQRVAQHVGTAPTTAIEPAIDPEVVKADMRRISRQRRPLWALQATTRWWLNRVGDVPACADLWGIERLAYQDGRGGDRSYHPAMIAVIRDALGTPVSMHRTWLTSDGLKASVPKPRKVMAVQTPPGCAIRLFPYADALGIAEGIETAVAATMLTGIPCWACLNTSGVRRWEAPEGVHIVIFADNDAADDRGARPGQDAAAILAGRLLVQGRNVEVRLPPREGMDWNDVLNERQDADRHVETAA